MINLIMSLILGAGLDSLYYSLFIINAKGMKNHKILTFILTILGYITMFMIIRYNMYLYLIFYVYLYFCIKKLYKAQIIDYFVLILSGTYYLLISIFCYYLIPIYLLALLINKILIFMPIIFSNKIHKMYILYTKMWNRNREVKMPIKSLTLRNIGLVMFNTFIIINYIVLLSLCS